MKFKKDHWITLGLSLVLISLYFVRGHIVFLALAIVFIITFIFFGKMNRIISNNIIRVVHWISLFITWTILLVSYVFLLTPIARIQCFLLQNPIRKRSPGETSHFITRNHIFRRKDFENQW